LNKKIFPLDKFELENVVKEYETPFHIYFKDIILEQSNKLNDAFSWCSPGFRNYFAVKATPNPHILNILYENGHGMDCSSMTELKIMNNMGISGLDIIYTSNNTPDEEFIEAINMGAILNIDDASHIDRLKVLDIIPEVVCFRFLPEDDKNNENIVIGSPTESKFGVRENDLISCYKELKDMGVKRFGLHTMQASNERSEKFFIKTSEEMFKLAKKISFTLDINIEFINLGGGLGINQHPDDEEINIKYIGDEIKKIYTKYFFVDHVDILPKLYMENGRYITGPAGYLITKARHICEKHKTYIGVDACMTDFMRPALYKDYHHISSFNDGQKSLTYDVVGSLCENNDKFAIGRKLPTTERGDLLIIHDTGAHGHAMGFNYNGKLKSSEILYNKKNDHEEIRRRETTSDLFTTIKIKKGVWNAK